MEKRVIFSDAATYACKMQGPPQNACMDLRNLGPIAQNIPLDSVLDFGTARYVFPITAGRSDPRPGVTPGVAEGAEVGGRSCPLRGLSRLAGRARAAVNSPSNVAEPAAFK